MELATEMAQQVRIHPYTQVYVWISPIIWVIIQPLEKRSLTSVVVIRFTLF